ncbi:MAG: phosphate acyltransferase PlsX [Rikenellaceae bacterium]
MVKIGLDAMGGDFAPEVAVYGAISTLPRLREDSKIVLFGDQQEIEKYLNGYSDPRLEIVHTTQVIEMGEHPAKAFASKSDSSIVVGFKHLKAGLIDGFASAGSTGAMMVGSMIVIGAVEGVSRPTICTPIATVGDKPMILLDAGLNVDCKPEQLNQYGTIGSLYAQWVIGVDRPRVALLNIGEESKKGNQLTKATHQLLTENKNINFVGNVEANHLFDCSVADVVVCDGFSGNTVLKEIEGVYTILKKSGLEHEWIDKLNYEFVGGTPVLGINSSVIIGHGRSSQRAIENMLISTQNTILANLSEHLRDALN